MSDPIPSQVWAIIEAFVTHFAVIRTAAGYNTDIGQSIVLYDQQRDSTDLPSIAMVAPSGRMDLRDQTGKTGTPYSQFARQVDFIMEAGLGCAPEVAHRIAHLALEDIEVVYKAFRKNNRAMPTGVSHISLTDWSIPNRSDGIDASVLRISGTVEYIRKPN
jgi:hypothetical protein